MRTKPVVVGEGTAAREESGAVEVVPAFQSTSRNAAEPAGTETEARRLVAVTEVQEAFAAAMSDFQEYRKSLKEAYGLLDRMNTDRYEALLELSALKGLPPPERPPAIPELSEVKRAVRPRRLRRVPPEEIAVTEAEVRAVARRRQGIALGVVISIGLFLLTYQVFGLNWFPNGFGREALTQIAGVGIFIQILFMGLLLFRLTALTSKGRGWLFPTLEGESHRRRRKIVRGR